MITSRWIVAAGVLVLTACAQDPRQDYADMLQGSRWQVTFGQPQPFVGCDAVTTCLDPAPKVAILPSGDVSGAEPGCVAQLSITVSDDAHPFMEQTLFEQSCRDGSSLECTGTDSTTSLACRWDDGQPFGACGGCQFDAALERLE